MSLTWRRRLAMRGIGIACGLLGIGGYEVYKAHRRDASVCAQLFSADELSRLSGHRIDGNHGFERDGECGFHPQTPATSSLDLEHELISIETNHLTFESAE